MTTTPKSKMLRRIMMGSCAGAILAAASQPALAATSAPGPVTPEYGKIAAFYGKIAAFYGDLTPFYGSVSPFYGKIAAFWTSDNPFAPPASPSAFYGANYDPFWGQGAQNPYTTTPSKYVTFTAIAPFWQTESASWQALASKWAAAKTAADYASVASALQSTIVSPASDFWNPAVTQGGTKTKTVAQIAEALLTAQGATYTNGTLDSTSLGLVTATDRALFFLNFYDQMMAASGVGHVDYWMGATNWSPALAQIAGAVQSAKPTIGMLDFTAVNNVHAAQGTILQYGSTQFNDGHGAAVQGLITGSVDGSNIMGVIPHAAANVAVFDPYDSTGTTNWTEIGKGYQTLVNPFVTSNGTPLAGAKVINASLGVPGWTLNPGWNTAFTGNASLTASGAAAKTVLVVAAGNEGVTQSANVPWNAAVDPSLIIVGSVGVNGQISNFSNRPGAACLTTALAAAPTSATAAPTGACVTTLASRFIVAPGELVLISDNSGNISRQSGTSLAAPLVTGAVGLLQTRWPWLANYPVETSQIILQSATRKGTKPGDDPVYGVGELNIAASQAPLSWSALKFYPVVNGVASSTPVTVAAVANTVKTGTQTAWNTNGLYFTAIENIGSTYRDFKIPFASKLVGQSTKTMGGNELFQSQLTAVMQSWVAGGAKFRSEGVIAAETSNFVQSSLPVGTLGGLEVRMMMAPKLQTEGYVSAASAMDTQFALIGSKTSVMLGLGRGAQALAGQPGLNQAADYNVNRGGANPLLGLASGGAFVDYKTEVLPNVALNFGVTQRRDVRDAAAFGIVNPGAGDSANVYEANAVHVGVDAKLGDRAMAHLSVTRLRENSGLLGVQSTDRADLGGGSVTTGATLGFDAALPLEVELSVSGTLANTRLTGAQTLATGPSGLTSSAGEIALSRSHLLAQDDRLRLTLSKSLQSDHGALTYAAYGVVDRTTGALGVINQSLNPAAQRTPISAEMLYARRLPAKWGEAGAYLRAETSAYDVSIGQSIAYVVGGRYRVGF